MTPPPKKKPLRDLGFVLLMIFVVPLLVALPFALTGFLGRW